MSDERHVELFLLKCAVIEAGLRASLEEFPELISERRVSLYDENLDKYIKQFQLENRIDAARWGSIIKYFTCWKMT